MENNVREFNAGSCFAISIFHIGYKHHPATKCVVRKQHTRPRERYTWTSSWRMFLWATVIGIVADSCVAILNLVSIPELTTRLFIRSMNVTTDLKTNSWRKGFWTDAPHSMQNYTMIDTARCWLHIWQPKLYLNHDKDWRYVKYAAIQ